MTKKHYQQFATLFGRHFANDETRTAHDLYKEFLGLLSEDNSRFDIDRFDQWVNEVKDGERDHFTGKRIKGAA